jgi:hypothetical protein
MKGIMRVYDAMSISLAELNRTRKSINYEQYDMSKFSIENFKDGCFRSEHPLKRRLLHGFGELKLFSQVDGVQDIEDGQFNSEECANQHCKEEACNNLVVKYLQANGLVPDESQDIEEDDEEYFETIAKEHERRSRAQYEKFMQSNSIYSLKNTSLLHIEENDESEEDTGDLESDEDMGGSLVSYKHIGEFRNGKMFGQGKSYHGDGSTREGYFVNNNIQKYLIEKKTSSCGKYMVDYIGQCRNGQYHGQGCFSYGNGDVYTGSFVDGERTGKAKTVFEDDSSHEGMYKNGIWCGYGTYRMEDGTVIRGDFRNGNVRGIIKIEYSKNVHKHWIRYDGYAFNGLPHGSGVVTFKNGDIFRGEFNHKTGRMTGTMKYASDGLKFSGTISEDGFSNPIPTYQSINMISSNSYKDDELIDFFKRKADQIKNKSDERTSHVSSSIIPIGRREITRTKNQRKADRKRHTCVMRKANCVIMTPIAAESEVDCDSNSNSNSNSLSNIDHESEFCLVAVPTTDRVKMQMLIDARVAQCQDEIRIETKQRLRLQQVRATIKRDKKSKSKHSITIINDDVREQNAQDSPSSNGVLHARIIEQQASLSSTIETPQTHSSIILPVSILDEELHQNRDTICANERYRDVKKNRERNRLITRYIVERANQRKLLHEKEYASSQVISNLEQKTAVVMSLKSQLLNSNVSTSRLDHEAFRAEGQQTRQAIRIASKLLKRRINNEAGERKEHLDSFIHSSVGQL